MTDKELLEYAAKAAGTRIRIYPGLSVERGTDCVCVTKNGFRWNPLADDGDALRLAVKLNLLDENPKLGWHLMQDYCGDPYAATRRAIVCAAAEIGKAMP